MTRPLTSAGCGLAAAALLLGACGGSSGSPAPSSPAGTLAPDAPAAGDVTVSEAEVAQIEQQLDDIDQLLIDLDAELAAD